MERMPIYFQKISIKNFDVAGNFYVKDSKGCNITMGILFLAAFILTACIDRFNTNEFSIYQLLYLSIIPGVYLIRRGIVNKIIMTINKSGFYYLDELITGWDNFIDAFVTQDEENRKIPYDVTDRFMLVIRYGKMGSTNIYARKILMTAVMDRSEEEIIAAIKFYFNHRDRGTILPYAPDEAPEPPPTPLTKPPLLK